MQKIKAWFLTLKSNPKKVVIFFLILIVVLGVLWLAKKYLFKTAPKSLYDVAVVVRDQRSSDGGQSLKVGDVLLTKEDGHKWSKTERISYLILKMNLTKEQSEKLSKAKDRKLTKDEKVKEIEQFKANRDDMPEEELKMFEEELEQRRETILMREYRINMEKKFPDFRANDLINGHPFDGEIFDWGIVKKRK